MCQKLVFPEVENNVGRKWSIFRDVIENSLETKENVTLYIKNVLFYTRKYCRQRKHINTHPGKDY